MDLSDLNRFVKDIELIRAIYSFVEYIFSAAAVLEATPPTFADITTFAL